MALAYRLGELLNIVVGIVVSECVFRSPIEILSVNEGDGALYRGFDERR